MRNPFTHKNLTEVKDSAVDFGHGDAMEARFAGADLDAEDTGFAFHRVKPGKRQPFGHRHEEAEEVYVIVRGDGRLKLDDEVIEVERLDAIRVAPEVTRAFEAGDEGLEVLVFGSRHDGDGELDHDFWRD
ncbi:MAG TPA: cupin domain-containing protein [Solirubrobacterales bacterium]|nr:cupin domain-containing protein [Solirubrobacterales bacterium]